MKLIFKIILFLSLLFSSLLSNIDECKSDLYYANGIMMKESRVNAKIAWQIKVLEIFAKNPEKLNKLANINISYNTSQGFIDDLFESFEQIVSNEWNWKALSLYIRVYLQTHNIQASDLHRPDLTAQVNAYKQSIKDGHGVIAIAHSQGNYYTNEAYEELDDWMKDYFYMFGVATPANHVAGYAINDTTAPYVKFHNDFIKTIVTGLDTNRNNPNLNHNSIISVEAHDFYSSYLTAENTKNDIFNFTLEKIQAHSTAPSQWQTDQELNKGTEDYKITVKHRFDSSIVAMNGVEVYPFAPSKKLYYVQGKFSEDISGYVKASCGGYKIETTWTGQDIATQIAKLSYTDTTLPHEYIENVAPKCDVGYRYNSGTGTCVALTLASNISIGRYAIDPQTNPNPDTNGGLDLIYMRTVGWVNGVNRFYISTDTTGSQQVNGIYSGSWSGVTNRVGKITSSISFTDAKAQFIANASNVVTAYTSPNQVLGEGPSAGFRSGSWSVTAYSPLTASEYADDVIARLKVWLDANNMWFPD